MDCGAICNLLTQSYFQTIFQMSKTMRVVTAVTVLHVSFVMACFWFGPDSHIHICELVVGQCVTINSQSIIHFWCWFTLIWDSLELPGGMDPAVLKELPPELLAEIESTMPLCERVKMNKRKRSTVNEKPKYAEVSSDDDLDANGECEWSHYFVVKPSFAISDAQGVFMTDNWLFPTSCIWYR